MKQNDFTQFAVLLHIFEIHTHFDGCGEVNEKIGKVKKKRRKISKKREKFKKNEENIKKPGKI